MTHHDGFLQDIIEHPGEDAPRLIYADWLEEHGQADRGEFIRVQCALAAPPWRVGRVYDDHAWLRLHARAGQLFDSLGRRGLARDVFGHLALGLDGHGWVWAAVVGDMPGTLAVLRRGFVAEVTLPCGQWMRHGPALVRAAPLERVGLSDKRPHCAGKARWFWLRRPAGVEGVDQEYWLPDELAYAMVAAERREGWESENAALEALSRACLKWARKPVTAAH